MISGFVANGAKVVAAVSGVEAPDEVFRRLLPDAEVDWTDVADISAGPWPVPDPAAVIILARTPTDLRRLVPLRGVLPLGKRIMVVVVETPSWHDAPHVAMSRGLGQRALREVRVLRYGTSGWVVTTRFAKELPSGDVAAAVARGLTGHHLNAYPLPAAGLGEADLADWRPGDPDVTCGGEPETSGVTSSDLAVRAPGAEWPDDRIPTVARSSWSDLAWTTIGAPGGYDALTELSPDHLPPVDERSVNPRGFLRTPVKGVGEISQHDGRWTASLDGDELVRFPESGLVTDTDVDRLRKLRGLRLTWRPAHTGPLSATRIVAGLSAAGVPLVAQDPPAWATAALGEDLIEHLTDGELPADLADDLRREERSVLLRRCALRAHGTTARWNSLATAAGLTLPSPPTISVVLATRRADFVRFALDQIGRQRDVDLEVVLALHGVSASSPEVAEAVQSFDRPLTVHEMPAAAPFGTVLNEAVARTSGTCVTKWDDDDWYSPDHLADLLLARAYSGADLVGVASEFFYLEQIDLTIRRRWASEMMADHVAGGTFLVSKETLDALGGFRPVPRSVDIELFTTLLRAGGCIYRTHGLGFVARRAARGRHTWQEPVGYFLHRAKDQWRGFRPSRLMEPA
ncbi:glycosyltransferase family A protein [Streptosporangium soli]|nr:glycosyltransferase family 2 protein [Streptosporangium sp. KLBMP 9127]